ncbi:hypothetical protein [Bogoriella caseilytica]|uniref:Uncharacterized protein n=1 Tax=Bogoriella caseilytica TaxID=56055 RepID=A0A3N2BC15_9MICO|nr:hypothetical protein [Bogoriella caseilytica]ROR72768.1 hypothetical protein EDD31_1127 [Bogoriella caseilytica]
MHTHPDLEHLAIRAATNDRMPYPILLGKTAPGDPRGASRRRGLAGFFRRHEES